MDLQEFGKLLQDDLDNEALAIGSYSQYAAVLTGLHRAEYNELFQDEAQDELGHWNIISQYMAAMGLNPVFKCPPVISATDIKDMLSNLLAAEIDAVERYSARADQAAQLGEHAFSVELENILTDELSHRDELIMTTRGM